MKLTRAIALPALAWLFASGTGTTCLSRESSYAVKDRHPIPLAWQLVGPAPLEQQLDLQIGLKSHGYGQLQRHLHEVSDPHHHRYGQHLAARDVRGLVQPSETTVTLVHTWLQEHGIRNIRYSSTQEWLYFSLSVGAAQSLLDTKYYTYQHVEDQSVVLRTPQWSLPLALWDHVDAVHPTNAFFGRAARPSRLAKRFEEAPLGLQQGQYDDLVEYDRTEHGHMNIPKIEDLPETFGPEEACNWLATTPLCLRAMYGTLDYAVQAPDAVRIGLVNYLDQVNNKSDIDMFLSRYRSAAMGASSLIRTEIVANGLDQQSPVTEEQAERNVAVEGNLNAQTILGLAYPIGITAYNVGGRPPFRESLSVTENHNEPYLEWLQYVLDQDDLPQIITTSYAEPEDTVPYWYAKRVCEGFAQLGARGVSVLFASGDDGVGQDDKCYSNDGTNTPKFLPTFPASCPYVTVIGGTRGWNPEIVGFDARRTFVAGGGFSNYFARPQYQDHAVATYIEKLDGMYDGLYNKTGRGYPDIALRSYHYVTMWNGTGQIIDGTSASSPAVAAIFALVYDALAAQGKPALGWLNPWLYSRGLRAFTDITSGSNPGCNTAGFPALVGWDASSGLGTPWFPTLKEIALESDLRITQPWYWANVQNA